MIFWSWSIANATIRIKRNVQASRFALTTTINGIKKTSLVQTICLSSAFRFDSTGTCIAVACSTEEDEYGGDQSGRDVEADNHQT